MAGYNIYQNQSLIGTTTKLFYTLTGLAPNTSYTLTVRAKDSSGIESADSPAVVKTTMPTQTVYNVTTYGAVGNGTTLNTAAIQQAIDACSAGGKVLIPSGTFKSGALFLKSNMTLQIDGTLLGSDNAADYPLTSMRFTYYTCKNYMGLINAYTTNYGSITNVRICGSGNVKGSADTSSITGHGITTLGKAQASAGGNDSARADMITMKGVTNLYIGGLNMTYPAEHTIFISFCKNVTINGINASTYDIHNADGVDLATTDTAYIFNSTFDT
ncbi:MAG TPA: glycosyl hydrolase family 28 protein, partial [Bacillota bacterium]|nr:glycosyl hydrolase family 28 protein [Bacillota bacterium]